MYLGKIVELANTEDLFNEPKHPYTKALISAVPISHPDEERERIILSGDVPSPANPPSGCAFHPRCSSCMEICKTESPPVIEHENGHTVACHLFSE
jgi:peptide/nickel transport system ATP-binding protein/oligopeptide transport system ATP-binding protein